MDSVECTTTLSTGSPLSGRMPLVEVRDVCRAFVAMCDSRTRLTLFKVCEETKRCVMEAIRKDCGLSLAKIGIVLRSKLPRIECVASKVPAIVKAASGQFILFVSQCCVLLFVPSGDRWVVAVQSDYGTATIGWKQPASEFSQRPIECPMTALPTVALTTKWDSEATAIKGNTRKMTVSGDTIAVGTDTGSMALLNAHTGAVVCDSLTGKLVEFLDEDRVVGVVDEGMGKWMLREFTGNSLSKEVLLEASGVASVKASADGKRLYVVDFDKRQLNEYCAANWHVTARIAFSGLPLGQCDITANGLLAQGIKHSEDDSYHIEVIETNSHCVTQTIATKHSAFIRQVVFSPDSTRIVSVSVDKSVQLFDAISGQMIGEPRIGHNNWVTSVCFLTDDWFATVSLDHSVIVWHCDAQSFAGRFEHAHRIGVSAVLRLGTDSFVTADHFGQQLRRWKFEKKSAASSALPATAPMPPMALM